LEEIMQITRPSGIGLALKKKVRRSILGTKGPLRLSGYLWVAGMFGLLAALEPNRIGLFLVPPFATGEAATVDDMVWL
jgi:hypothetical protein